MVTSLAYHLGFRSHGEELIKNQPVTQSEEVYRNCFISTVSNILRVKHTPVSKEKNIYRWSDGLESSVVNEQKFIAHLSKAVFESTAVQDLSGDKRWSKYKDIMLGAYKGDHLLIEDDHVHTYTKKLVDCGAIIRGSSHYEKGRNILEWKEGLPVYDNELHPSLKKADVHHYGITGKHLKHVLFNEVDMRETVAGDLIVARTARQVDALVENSKLKIKGKIISLDEIKKEKRHFTALQFEASPDSEGNNWRDALFYTHRLYGFITYRVLKFLGVQNANIGAYGYGRTDEKPVILYKHSLFKVNKSLYLD